MKIFSLMRVIFGKPASAPAPDADISADTDSTGTVSTAVEYESAAETAPPAAAARAAVQAPPPEPKVDVTSSEIALPLSSIVASLPVELQQRVRTNAIGQAVCAFPLDKILGQLSQDRKSTRLNSSHGTTSRMPSSA